MTLALFDNLTLSQWVCAIFIFVSFGVGFGLLLLCKVAERFDAGLAEVDDTPPDWLRQRRDDGTDVLSVPNRRGAA